MYTKEYNTSNKTPVALISGYLALSKIERKDWDNILHLNITKSDQYSCKLRETFVATEKKDPCWLGSWPIRFRWKTIQIICSFIQLLTRHSTRMTTAIKTTKQKSPEACYDKVILKAKQIHSYIDFQEHKFNGKKTNSLITSITPNLISGKNKHTSLTTAAIEHSDHPRNVNTGVSCNIDKVILYSWPPSFPVTSWEGFTNWSAM